MAIVLQNCSSPNPQISTGDLVFVEARESALEKAIDDVTNTGAETHFTHVGLLSVEGEQTYIYHSSFEHGVIKERLDSFIMNHVSEGKGLYHYKHIDYDSIDFEQVLAMAKEALGTPYNYSYRPNAEGLYCSQFIYKLFATYNIFSLEPMSFKNAKDGTPNPNWVSYYKKLNLDIPEGELGCNPNGLAQSEKIKYYGQIK